MEDVWRWKAWRLVRAIPLVVLAGCAATHEVPGDCTPADNAWLETAPQCGDPEVLYISNSHATFDGCEVLRSRVDFSYSSRASVPEFAGLRAIPLGVSFFEARSLADLSGLRSIEVLGNSNISRAPVRDLTGLDRLRVGLDALSVYDMPNLTSLHGLEALQEVHGTLGIWSNPQLTSLSGLRGLCRVDGDLQIHSNPLLPQSEIDALLAHVEVGGEVVLEPIVVGGP